jgi:hypothetical protein
LAPGPDAFELCGGKPVTGDEFDQNVVVVPDPIEVLAKIHASSSIPFYTNTSTTTTPLSTTALSPTTTLAPTTANSATIVAITTMPTK